MSKRWYIVHAYSNFERKVADAIKDRAKAAALEHLFDEVRQETSKVTWPAWKEVWITTAMVLVMVTLTAVFFLITDMIIGNVVNFVLRLGQ